MTRQVQDSRPIKPFDWCGHDYTADIPKDQLWNMDGHFVVTKQSDEGVGMDGQGLQPTGSQVGGEGFDDWKDAVFKD